MKGTTDLLMAVRAGYSMFYCQTMEINNTISIIRDAIQTDEFKNVTQEFYQLKVWDFDQNPDPSSCLEMLDTSPAGTIVLAKNWNWFLEGDIGPGSFNKEFVSRLQNNVDKWSESETRKTLIILSDNSFESAIPKPLQKNFMAVNFPLPDEAAIEKIYDYIVDSASANPKFKTPSDVEKKKIIAACKGLTEHEIKNALPYSIISDRGELNPLTVSKIQAREIEKTAGLKLGEFNMDEDDLQGYSVIKNWVLNTIDHPLARGIMLVGPPGTGKTTFCKYISSMTKKKVIILEMAELFGGLVGDTERLVREAIEIIKANTPCILFVDEIEKGLAGANGSGNNDGGTTKRAMAQFLKLLSDDRPEGMYVMATCNGIQNLAPEWVRPGRWDCAPFFIDLPNTQEQNAIFQHYLDLYDVELGKIFNTKDWSGAEIEQVCKNAAMLGVTCDKASAFIKPVSLTMKEDIDGLRKWADTRTIKGSEAEEIVENMNKRKIDY
jgi:AAA+ superfamily predicted ATPase